MQVRQTEHAQSFLPPLPLRFVCARNTFQELDTNHEEKGQFSSTLYRYTHAWRGGHGRRLVDMKLHVLPAET